MKSLSVFNFKESLKKEQLLGCKCIECKIIMAPPRMICTNCGSSEVEAFRLNERGTIKTKTVIHVPLTKFKDFNPYTVGIVDLDEGPSITGLILGDNETIEIGDKVKVVYLDEGEEKILAFKKI